jgi:hypothetical protein
MEVVLLDRTDQQDLGVNESSPETAGAHAVDVTDAGLRRHEMEMRPSRERHSLRIVRQASSNNELAIFFVHNNCVLPSSSLESVFRLPFALNVLN